LSGIHDAGASVTESVTAAWRLIALAASMRDEADELLVVAALADSLAATNVAMTGTRQTINGWMGLCSFAPIVAAKGQALINLVSETEQMVGPVSQKIRGRLK